MVYSFLEFREKFRMIYLCKKEYKFLAEWKLPRDQFAPVDGGTSLTVTGFGFDPSRQYVANFKFDEITQIVGTAVERVVSSPPTTPLNFNTIVFTAAGNFQVEQNATLTVSRSYPNPSGDTNL